MTLIDIQSRERKPLTIQLVGPVENMSGTVVKRTVAALDRKTGQVRAKDVTHKNAPVLRIPARGKITGISADVLKAPQLKSLIKSRRVVVTRTYTA